MAEHWRALTLRGRNLAEAFRDTSIVQKKTSAMKLMFAVRQESATLRTRPNPVGHREVFVRPVWLRQPSLDALAKTVVRNYFTSY